MSLALPVHVLLSYIVDAKEKSLYTSTCGLHHQTAVKRLSIMNVTPPVKGRAHQA